MEIYTLAQSLVLLLGLFMGPCYQWRIELEKWRDVAVILEYSPLVKNVGGRWEGSLHGSICNVVFIFYHRKLGLNPLQNIIQSCACTNFKGCL